MQTLAVKYRPKTFDDVVEQGPVKQILQEQLANNSHKNCYLFTGGAGTGKTTIARIFANEINGFKGNPIEIDAASNNGVDNVREIIDNAKFKALDAPFKVYIIDECHMLSNGAWNAMLKLIEEPPAQTIFIFCTTDPQKIPPTILSRVQRYDFNRITHDSVVNRLKHIMIMENEEACQSGCDGAFEWEEEAFHYIAKLADGGMRDAITLLDKCLSFNPYLSIDNVVEALGTVNYEVMFDLLEFLLSKDGAGVLTTIEELHRSGVDLKQFVKQFNHFIVDLCKFFYLRGFDFLQLPSTYQHVLENYHDDEYDFIFVLLKELKNLNAAVKWETSPKALIQASLLLLLGE